MFYIKNKFYYIFLFLLLSFNLSAQLAISTSGTATQWVQNILVGNGVAINNVTYTGAAGSIGTFTSGATGSIGFSSGIVLSTGNVTQLPGSGSAFCSSNMGNYTDPDLDSLITQSINDAAVLEFDFIPIADTVSFRYVFGSEEYPEFVNSFNDVFGFFVTGLNPAGGFYNSQNIALIPGTTNPVSIYNVNNGSTNSGPCVNCQYYVNNANGTFVKLDAYTTVLTAWVRVYPCVTYHIKIAIGDAGDHVYDSGVFLEANSFSSSMLTITQSTSSTVDSIAVEGCNDAILTFRLPYVKATSTIVNYSIGGTAVNGVDYSSIANSVIIPAGQDSINLVISPLTDTIVEPIEYIELVVNTSPCSQDTVRVYIKDNMPPLANVFSDTIICGGSNLDIISNPTGGYTPYTFLWSNGDTTSSITVNPVSNTLYTLKVTDACLNDTISDINVNISNPSFLMDGDTICTGDTAVVSVVTSRDYDYLWNNGSQTKSIKVTPTLNTQYIVTVTDSLGCDVDKSTSVGVFSIPIVITSSDTIICDGYNATLKAFGNYSFKWSTGSSNSSITVSPTSTEYYTVTIKNDANCKNSDSIRVDLVEFPNADIYLEDDTICLGKTIVLQGSGGDDYLWNSGATSPNISIMPTAAVTYSLTVTNNDSYTHCSDDTSVTINVEQCNYFYFPNAFTPNGDGLNDFYGMGGRFEAVVTFEMYIYNRWGKLVFQTNDPNEKWDGKVDGVDAIDGVYSYAVFIDEMYREPYNLAGTFTLYR